jgi:hypothetical protein
MGIDSLIDDAIGLVKANPITSAVGVGAAVVGGSVLGAAIIGTKAKKKTRKSTRRKSKTRKHHRHSKTKHKSTRRIHYTKKGQPYVYLANGRARFIKKSSARSSKKRKGGRY